MQSKHLFDGIHIHRSKHTKKVIKRFYVDKAHPLSTPTVAQLLDVKDDPFRSREDEEEQLSPEVPFLSAWCTNLSLIIHDPVKLLLSLLARYSSFLPEKLEWS